MSDNEIDRLFSNVRTFEWDDNKRRLNVLKHGIDFAEATQVFDDPKQYTYRSPQRSTETRYVSVGLCGGVLLAVVFTPRDTRLRIISARAARRHERERYG